MIGDTPERSDDVVPLPVDVRPLTREDAERLGGEYAGTWDGQSAGQWTLLTAWLDHRLVGSGMLRWEGPFIPDIARRLPDQVEIGFLQVSMDLRGHGIGTALMSLGESMARARSIRSLGLAVGDDNIRARRLYERLGYRSDGLRYTIQYESVDERGGTRTVEESGIYMLKDLS